MIPRFKPYFDLEEIKALFYAESDVIEKFEETFANLVGCKYAVVFPHGRSALFAILKSMVTGNSEILIPSYTCVVVPSIIVASNNIPRFADISLKDYNMVIDNAVAKVTEKTKVVIPTHMYGYPADIKKLRDCLDEDVLIVEDAALALLTRDVGRFGDVAFYSLGPYKQLFTFGGGVVTTNNEEMYEKLKNYVSTKLLRCGFCTNVKKILKLYCTYVIYSRTLYSTFDIWQKRDRTNFYTKNFDSYEKHIPNNFLMTYSKIQAKIGISQLKKAREIVKRNQRIAEYYTKELYHLREKISLPFPNNGTSYSNYTIRVRDRDTFEKNMQKKGIQINTLFSYSLPHLPGFKTYADEKLVNSLCASKSVVNLPAYPSLLDKPETLDYIVTSIEECIA